ncbi:hypothetical protein [Actinoplanes missouriensis]|nr:hypothetical protein [Actinoplanes missouriensis]KOX45279.1 hypothetical protein ADL19_23315 [Streptomyces purpurogeneiscleroticus]
MITGLGAWLAVVIVSLVRGQLPDAILLGVPAGLVLALAPPAIGRSGGGSESPSPGASAEPRDGAQT